MGFRTYLVGEEKGVALLSYLPLEALAEAEGQSASEFNYKGIARAFLRALGALGFVVDVISWDDTRFRPARPYDVVILHGGLNVRSLAAAIGPNTRVVYFATGMYWSEHNRREMERLDAFEQRTGVRLTPERLTAPDEEWALERADAIIALGSDSIRRSYERFHNIRNLDLAVSPSSRKIERDFELAREHFLFFSGAGNIHKGLDLAIEAFERLPYHLHIATAVRPELRVHYRDLLARCPNIHVHGWVPFGSARFAEIAETCAFVLLPSSAEGQPGSVIECMSVGLVPLVTAETNLDVDGFGEFVDGSVEGIRRVVTELARLDPGQLEARSRAALHTAATRHSPDRYVDSLARYLGEAVTVTRPGR
jgi:glycosyltransferase involved in cell wall biosynthesis